MTLLFNALVLLLCCPAAAAVAAPSCDGRCFVPPHPPKYILTVLADDYGWHNIEYHNNNITSPTLSRLASEGVALNRHYVYKYCSPTRSSMMTGRLPIHVTQNNRVNDVGSTAGADLRMTTLPSMLKTAPTQKPFKTHMVGKWHLGARSPSNVPTARGFDTFFGFLKGMEDHFTQHSGYGGYSDPGVVDLWRNGAPAYGENGTGYSAEYYADESVKILQEHDLDSPLYLHVTWQNTHGPIQAPHSYMNASIDYSSRRTYYAMVNAIDAGMRRIVQVLEARHMWNDTLIIFSADNGAPNSEGGNNYPLRGSKTSSFEGGVRANAFISGGYIPEESRGTVSNAYVHVCDWYGELCALVGGKDCKDAEGASNGVPGVDSAHGVLNAILSNNTIPSPRVEIPLAICTNVGGPNDQCAIASHRPGTNLTFDQAALINGTYKVVYGNQHGLGIFTGPNYPNSSHDGSGKDRGCPQGCLFDLVNDETEHHDIKDEHADVFAAMMNRIREIGKTVFQTDYADPFAMNCLPYAEAKQKYKQFLGPVCFNSTHAL